ncbi:MAG: DUF2569 family protein [bacterium]|nr:DUF2569 family protein [bacterium]
MYCNNCGKQNPDNSKFCRNCGSEIIRLSASNKTQILLQTEPENREVSEQTAQNKVNTGLGGWLIIVGISLILGLIFLLFGLIEYFPLLSEDYDIPGYLTLLQFEFFTSFIFVVFSIYLINLYFKKNINFPKSYILFLVTYSLYAILDHFLLASLEAPSSEAQQLINDTLSENLSTVSGTIVSSVIWIAYMNKSKRVKGTFISEK